MSLPYPAAPEYETELVTGLAHYLHSLGLAHFTEPAIANPEPTVVPSLFFGAMPPEPPLACTVNWYDELPAELGVSTHLVQIRYRVGARHRDMTSKAGALREALHDKRYLKLGRVTASRVSRFSFFDLGLNPDTPRTRDFTANYAFTGLRYLHPAP